MMTETQRKNLAKGKKFSSEYQPEKAGRRASKLKGFIDANDICKEDVSDLILSLFDKTQIELEEIAMNPDNPFLLRSFVKAMLKDMGNDGLYNINSLLDRAIGKATDKKEVNHTTIDEDGKEIGINTKNITEEEAKEAYLKLKNEN